MPMRLSVPARHVPACQQQPLFAVASAMADSYVFRFECAICQGVNDYKEACTLNCGHPFHVVCVEQWLSHSSSATCPSCRAKVNRRSIRPILGIDCVPDAQGDEAAQQLLASKQQEVIDLQQLANEHQQQCDHLQSTVAVLTAREDRLQNKLADAKKRLTALETALNSDRQRINTLTAEKEKLLERYKTEVLKLQSQLREEERRVWRAEADNKRMRLNNPQLISQAAIQQLAATDQQRGDQQPQSVAALAAVLAQRNRDLKEAQQQVQQLQEQQLQQQAAVQQQIEAAQLQHAAHMGELEKDKEQHMKEALRLEYENDNLKSQMQQQERQLKQQEQELQDLKGVLVALQGGSMPFKVLQESSNKQRPTDPRQQQQQQQENQAAICQSKWQQIQKTSSRPNPHSVSTAGSNDPSGKPLHHAGPGEAPTDSCDKLLSELLGEDEVSLPGPQQQTVGQGSAASATHPASQQQLQQTGLKRVSTRTQCSNAAADIGGTSADAVLTGGASVLRAPAVLMGMPSFVAKAKQGAALNLAGGATTTGQYIRQGPDGRGGRATHVAPSKKRTAANSDISANKKQYFVSVKSGRAEAAKGIQAYFASSRG